MQEEDAAHNQDGFAPGGAAPSGPPPDEHPGVGGEVAAFIWETVKVIVISLAIILPIRYYLIQPFFVKGASMEENFHDGDYLLIDEISYRFNPIERGDVVIFRYPLDPSQFFIKRIIGLPSETVEVKDNHVVVHNEEFPDGFTLKEDYLAARQRTVGNMRVKLDENEYFVMGDNRLESSDSRIWGAVNRTFITGRVFVRPWPPGKSFTIPEVTYPTP